jgi:tRNA (guanine-N7-)-methyltransferase
VDHAERLAERESDGRAVNGEIPSYQVRRGRTGPTSRAAHARLWPVYGIEPPYDGLVRSERTVLEIGFGMGEATAAMATASPDVEVLAVEVHPAGVMALLRRLEEAALSNVRVIEGDAVEVLAALPSSSLAEVRLFFPDPWPKTRHAKRRFLRPSNAALLADRLAPQGFLHLATDWPAYAEHAREALTGWDIHEDRRDRPVTGYERRALTAGRLPVDLVARPPR